MKYFNQVFLSFIYLFFMSQATWGMEQDKAENEEGLRKVFFAGNSQPDSTEEICTESIFLGPRAENADILEKLVVEILRDHKYWRINFHPNDPSHITEEKKRSLTYLKSQNRLQEQLRLLLADLKKSLPTFSFRYQGHINWEVSIPSVLGYIATLFHNSNNVSFEGSAATSFMEEQVARDFCKLIGYDVKPVKGDNPNQQEIKNSSEDKAYSWGQLTSCGTTANIQALWAARNLKFFPFAIRWAFEESSLLRAAKEKLMVRLPAGEEGRNEKKLWDLSPWELFNIENEEALNLPGKILKLVNESRRNEVSLSLNEIYNEIAKYSLQKKGIHSSYRRISMLHKNQRKKENQKEEKKEFLEPIVIIPGTAHYSFPKAVSLLGLGEESLRTVKVDLNTRMDFDSLETELIKCAGDQQPVISVVCVLGTTEESAVDPLLNIINLRGKLRKSYGFDFHIHVDAAFGGYHTCLVNKEQSFLEVPSVGLSLYVEEQIKALADSDSVTIDPHKSGYIPYPAGGICFKDERIKWMLNFSAPVLGTSDRDLTMPTVGIYGIEGSKPGTAAAAVYLSHRVIPLTSKGHGKLLGQALYTTKEFFLRLLMIEDDKEFIVAPLAQLNPDPKSSKEIKSREEYVKDKKEFLEKNPLPSSSKEREGKEFHEKLSPIGPDLNMLVYAFNFKTKGNLNTDLEKANKFNALIYEKLKPQPQKEISEYKLILSNTSLESNLYGTSCLENYMKKLGINPPAEKEKSEKEEETKYSMNVLRSVVMNPWATETEKGSMLEIVIKDLISAVESVLKDRKINGLDN